MIYFWENADSSLSQTSIFWKHQFFKMCQLTSSAVLHFNIFENHLHFSNGTSFCKYIVNEQHFQFRITKSTTLRLPSELFFIYFEPKAIYWKFVTSRRICRHKRRSSRDSFGQVRMYRQFWNKHLLLNMSWREMTGRRRGCYRLWNRGGVTTAKLAPFNTFRRAKVDHEMFDAVNMEF